VSSKPLLLLVMNRLFMNWSMDIVLAAWRANGENVFADWFEGVSGAVLCYVCYSYYAILAMVAMLCFLCVLCLLCLLCSLCYDMLFYALRAIRAMVVIY
jgi:hypothetical protein